MDDGSIGVDAATLAAITAELERAAQAEQDCWDAWREFSPSEHYSLNGLPGYVSLCQVGRLLRRAEVLTLHTDGSIRVYRIADGRVDELIEGQVRAGGWFTPRPCTACGLTTHFGWTLEDETGDHTWCGPCTAWCKTDVEDDCGHVPAEAR